MIRFNRPGGLFSLCSCTAAEGNKTDGGYRAADRRIYLQRQVNGAFRGMQQESGAHAGHEQGRNHSHETVASLSAQTDGYAPECEAGQTLVAPAEIAPDGGEIKLGNQGNHGKKRNCQGQSRQNTRLLHSVFAYGRRQEWCTENPVERVVIPRVQEREIVPLQREEVERLENAAKRPEQRAMRFSLYLLLYCGLRPKEVARIRPQHVQWEKVVVVVSAQCSKTGGGRVVPLRKNVVTRCDVTNSA